MSDQPIPREISVLVNRCGAMKTLVGVKMDEIMAYAQMQDGKALDRVREEIHDIVNRYCDELVAMQVVMRKHFGIDP